MKVALILPGAIWFSPFVRIYTRILDKNSVNYSLISWNREGDDKEEGFQYNVTCDKGHSSAGWRSYLGYVRYIKRTLRRERFDKVIVFGPQIACLLSAYLIFHFRGRYIIDYRDLSIEQKPGLKQLFSLMLRISYANIISSPGFKKCLPKLRYYISHNFNAEKVREEIAKPVEGGFNTTDGIDVLTIGGIRDYSSNIEIVKALSNKVGYKCRFVGKGFSSQLIESYCREHRIENVEFYGYYDKEDEPSFIQSSTFLNIYYPRVITHDTAMSNRFYNSLLFKRPMIVTKGTTQGDYVEQYQLGVAIDNCNCLVDEMNSFLNSDYDSYYKRCNLLLNSFLEDQDKFESMVVSFITE